MRQFLKRNPGLTELKNSNIGYHQAKQATKEVRDAVFDKLQVRFACYVHTTLKMHTHAHIHTLQALLDRLVGSGILTAYERHYELDKLMW